MISYKLIIGTVLWGLLSLFIIFQNPLVMQDELVYRLSSLRGLSGGSDYGDYLPSLLFNLSNLCGPEFYVCAKTINLTSILLVSSGTIALLSNSGLLSSNSRFSLIWAISPVILYASLFTPDALYLSLGISAVALAAALTLKYSARLKVALVAVMVLALLTKPHSLLLLVLLAVGVLMLGRSSVGAKESIRTAATVFTLSLAGRLGIGFAIWGQHALNPLGSVYSKYLEERLQAAVDFLPETVLAASSGLSFSQSLESQKPSFWDEALSQLPLYLAALTLLIAPAVILIFARWHKSCDDGALVRQLFWMSVIVLAGFVPLTIAFGSFITINGDIHSNRLLLRYFEFAIFSLYLAALIVQDDDAKLSRSKIATLGLFLGLVVASLAFLQGKIDVQPFDAISLSGIFGNPYGGTIFVALLVAMIGTLLWVPSMNHGTLLAVAGLIPILAMVSLESGGRSSIAAYEREAQINAEKLSSSDALVVAGVDRTKAELASFWIGNPNVSLAVRSGSVILTQGDVQRKGTVLYLTDEVAVQGSFNESEFRVEPRILDLSSELLPLLEVPGGVVDRLSGVSATSALGNWADNLGMRATLNQIWEDGEQIEISLVSVGQISDAVEIDACGEKIPFYPEEIGAVTSITLTAPPGFYCDNVGISSSQSSNYVILVSMSLN